jgi:hypothetical protein
MTKQANAAIICLCGHPEGHHIESKNRGAALEVPAIGIMTPTNQGGLGKDHGCFVHAQTLDKDSPFERHWPPVCRCAGFTPVLRASGWGNWFRSHSPRERAPGSRDVAHMRYLYPPLAISLIKIQDENTRRQELARSIGNPSNLPAKDRPRDLDATLTWLTDCQTCGVSPAEAFLFPYFANENLDPAIGCPTCIIENAYDPARDPGYETRLYKEDRV